MKEIKEITDDIIGKIVYHTYRQSIKAIVEIVDKKHYRVIKVIEDNNYMLETNQEWTLDLKNERIYKINKKVLNWYLI
jgi:uncharacterized protein (DUF2344 family)